MERIDRSRVKLDRYFSQRRRNIYNRIIAIGSSKQLVHSITTYHHGASRFIISDRVSSLFFSPVVDFRGLVEAQRVYFLRARTGYLFPGATGSCTGRSCGTTVKHRRGTQDYERRSSEQPARSTVVAATGELETRWIALEHRVQSTMYRYLVIHAEMYPTFFPDGEA